MRTLRDGEVTSISNDPASGETQVGTARALSTVLIEFDTAIQIESPIE